MELSSGEIYNLLRDEVVQNSACARIGTKPKQKTESSKEECGRRAAECVATHTVRARDGGQPSIILYQKSISSRTIYKLENKISTTCGYNYFCYLCNRFWDKGVIYPNSLRLTYGRVATCPFFILLN